MFKPRQALLFLCAAAIFAGLALTAEAQAPQKFALERYIPDNCIVFVSVNDVEASKAEFAKTNFGRLINDPSMKQAMAPLGDWASKTFKKGLDNFKNKTGIGFEDALAVLNGQCAFSLYEPVPDAYDPQMIFSIDAGPKKAVLEAMLKKFEENFFAEAEGAQVVRTKVQNVDMSVWKEGERELFACAFLGNALVVSNSKDLVKTSCAAFSTGEAVKSLAAVPSLAKAREKLGVGCEIFAFANFDAIMPMLAGLQGAAPEGVDALATVGVKNIKYMCAGIEFLPTGEYRTRYYTSVAGEKTGFVRLIAMDDKPVDQMLKMCPSNTFGAAVLNLDLKGKFSVLSTMMAGMGGFEAEMFDSSVKDAEAALGVQSIENDILGLFDSQFLVYLALPPNAGGFLPDKIMCVKVTDQAKLETFFKNLIVLSDMFELKEIKYKNSAIKYVATKMPGEREIPSYAQEQIVGIKVAINYLIGMNYIITKDGYLVTADTVQGLKRFVDRMESPAQKTLFDTDFVKKAAQEGKLNSGMFVYNDMAGMCAFYGDTAVALLSQFQVYLRMFGLPIDAATLPSGTELSKFFTPGILTMKSDADGVMVESVGADALSLTAASSALGGVAGFMQALSEMKSKLESNESLAAIELKNVMMSEYSYYATYGLYWTGDVSALYRTTDESGAPLALVNMNIAKADFKPVAQAEGTPSVGEPLVENDKPVSHNGYYFVAVEKDQNGELYFKDNVDFGLGKGNISIFAFCAFPSTYGKTGNYTFIVSEWGEVFRKDLGGKPLEQWPADPAADGWEKVPNVW